MFSLGVIPTPPEMDALKNELINQEVGMAEMFVSPNSVFVGREINLGHYLKQTNVQLLAASRNNRPLTGKIRIEAGDAFVIRGTWENIETLKSLYENVVISGSP